MAYVRNSRNNDSIFEVSYIIIGVDCAENILTDARIETDGECFIINVPAGREAKTIVNIFKDVLGIDYQEKRLTIDEYERS